MESTQQPGVATTAGRSPSDGLARLALKLDGVVTGLNGLSYLALATALDSFLGFDTAVQYPVGVFLLVYGIGVLTLGLRETINRGFLRLVMVANLAWTVLSIVVLATDALTPTGVGQVWIVLQALVVGGFAALQYVGLKRC